MQLEQLKKFKSNLLQIAAKHGVSQIYVFGSTARGETTDTSDVDLLIELDSQASALGVGGFQCEAQNLLGIKVDVVPTFALKTVSDETFVQAVETEAIPL